MNLMHLVNPAYNKITLEFNLHASTLTIVLRVRDSRGHLAQCELVIDLLWQPQQGFVNKHRELRRATLLNLESLNIAQ